MLSSFADPLGNALRGEIPVRPLRQRRSAIGCLWLVDPLQNPFGGRQSVATVLAGHLRLLARPNADHEIVLFVKNGVPFFRLHVFHQQQVVEQPLR
jgi:hypothetical protein